MKKNTVCMVSFLLGLTVVWGTFFLSGCGEKEKNQREIAVGNWTQMRNRAYILLITNPKGEWNSSVRIADATEKIVQSKGKASGTWHIENDQMIFTVTESDIETVWKKNSTSFQDIVELSETVMQLREESGRLSVWKKTAPRKSAAAEENLNQIIDMGPVVVNLNKNRSSDKDRYLCMDLKLVLNELMPDQSPPPIHPKAREAAIIFLSSLVFDNVKDFDRIKEQNIKLKDVLNPYLEGIIKRVDVAHVIVASDIGKVEEFIIEHTLTEEPAPEEGEQTENGEETDQETE